MPQPKITFLGAGSSVFARNLLQDLFTFPELRDATISLMDIDPSRLADTEGIAHLLAEQLEGVGPERAEIAFLRGLGQYALSEVEAAIRSLDDLPEDDWRRSNPRFQQEAREETLRLADRVGELAEQIGATPAQVALAWIVAHGVTAPIASATTVPQLQEIAGSMRLRLDADSVRELDAASVGSEPKRPPG